MGEYTLTYSDHELNNKSPIQLIKDQTLDNVHHVVEFQPDLFSGKIQYQDLLKHLSVAFQGGNNETNLLAEFYSHVQKTKESEDVFTDELQILARKVISKKPNFHINLDSMLKQRYATQLYDCNNTSIAKTLLIQMPKVSFTKFWNELAQVLGTRQWAISRVSSKAMSAMSAKVKSERRRHNPSPKLNGTKRSVLNPPRSKTCRLN